MAESDTSNSRQTPPLLIVISGPSGVGKDAVIQCMRQRDLPIHFVVTATSRPSRPDEQHGVNYIFVSTEKFEEMIQQGELLEYAIVYDQYKGIPKAQVRQAFASGKDVVLRVDVQGAATLRRLYPDALLIFLTTQSEHELKNRLLARGEMAPEQLELRMATARQELEAIQDFDYVIVNRDAELDETVNIIHAIICAEHHRVHPRKVTL